MRVRDAELNTQIVGTGTPLVWGHGLMGSMAAEEAAGMDWKPVEQVARLLRYDARGHGSSEAINTPDEARWNNLALDMLALADQLGLAQFIAGGQSMGSAMALYAALEQPERVRGLVLMNPPTAWETRQAQAAVYTQMAEIVETSGTKGLVAAMQAQPQPVTWHTERNTTAQWLDTLLTSNPQSIINASLGAAQSDLPAHERIATLRVPTLILAWTDDPGHPMSTAETLHALIPDSELVAAHNEAELATWPEHIARFVAAHGLGV